MTSLAALKSLIGGKGAKRRYGGWVRVDSDQVIRGWVSDEADLAFRAEVEVLIDGEPVARARADRLDAKLVDEGRGDGRYAFAVTVPDRHRDGREHRFEARTADGVCRLMSKRQTFKVGRRAAAPWIVIEAIEPGLMRGVMRGFGGDAPILELWDRDRRLEPPLAARWRWRGPEREFTAELPVDRLSALAPDARLAAAGMVEAGQGAASVFDDVRLIARPTRSGVSVRLAGRFRPPLTGVEAYLRRGPTGDLVASAPLTRGEGVVALPAAQAADGLWVEVTLDGRPLAALSAPVDLSLERLNRNAALERWTAQGPAGWNSGDASPIERGFHAFGPIQSAHGLSGDLARFSVSAGSAPLLMTQTLAELPDGPRQGTMTALLRVSAPLGVALRLTGEDGTVLQASDAAIAEAWTWTHLEAAVDSATLASDAPIRLELAVTRPPDSDAFVEVAGARVGGKAAFKDKAAGPLNYVGNARLLDWPRGVIVEAGPARGETAAGWFVHNRGGAEPVRAAARPSEAGDACVLALSAPEVADYCRLEISVDPQALRQPRLTVGFEANAGGGVTGGVRPAPFVVVERVFLIGRSGEPAKDSVIATATRRLLVDKESRFYAFSFDLPQDIPPVEQLFLAFDFGRPFQIDLGAVSLAPAAAAAADERPHIALEDPAIAAQAGMLKGLSQWVSPEVVGPDQRHAPRTAGAASARWSWDAAAQGTVEIVVCVHNAAEETLACLRSLVGASAVPHTVRIVDDASGEDTRRRLLDFVADKPWMRLVSNGENKGYTASANLGVRASDADWVILLNSDTIVTPGWIEGLLETAASDSAIAFVGPVSNAGSYQSVPELKGRGGGWKTNQLPAGWSPADMAAFVRENADKSFPRLPLLNGFCTLIRRDAFIALGGFDEGAFPAGYGEENDLCLRAAAAGYGLAVADHVYVHHAKSASFGAKRRAELQKQAGEALARLHPGVDFAELGDRMRETPGPGEPARGRAAAL